MKKLIVVMVMLAVMVAGLAPAASALEKKSRSQAWSQTNRTRRTVRLSTE
jgi:hypothetical protein